MCSCMSIRLNIQNLFDDEEIFSEIDGLLKFAGLELEETEAAHA